MKHITLLEDIHQCTLCKDVLPNNPRPVIQISSSAKLLIIGQAPGIKAHQNNKPFSDASGARLRTWLNMNDTEFYDATKIAIMPMGGE